MNGFIGKEGLWIACVAVGVVLVLRLALPLLVKGYLNRTLQKHALYGGSVGKVRMALWRGSFELHEVSISKETDGVIERFLFVAKFAVSIRWNHLVRGKLVAEVQLDEPELNWVVDAKSAPPSSPKKVSLEETLKGVLPFNLTRLELRNGQVYFRNRHCSPPFYLYVDKLTAVALNITNTVRSEGELPTRLQLRGSTIGAGDLQLQLRLNPLAAAPTFELACEITNVDLVALNDFLKAYGKFDVERGVFSLFTSVASKNGSYEGSLKVVLEHLDVFAWKKERDESVLGFCWQAVLGAVTTILKNQAKDRLATEVPLSGTYEDADVGVWSAVGTLLKNAFVRALVPKMERQVTLEEVDTKKKKAAV